MLYTRFTGSRYEAQMQAIPTISGKSAMKRPTDDAQMPRRTDDTIRQLLDSEG